jgi:hypothetical protein
MSEVGFSFFSYYAQRFMYMSCGVFYARTIKDTKLRWKIASPVRFARVRRDFQVGYN